MKIFRLLACLGIGALMGAAISEWIQPIDPAVPPPRVLPEGYKLRKTEVSEKTYYYWVFDGRISPLFETPETAVLDAWEVRYVFD